MLSMNWKGVERVSERYERLQSKHEGWDARLRKSGQWHWRDRLIKFPSTIEMQHDTMDEESRPQVSRGVATRARESNRVIGNASHTLVAPLGPCLWKWEVRCEGVTRSFWDGQICAWCFNGWWNEIYKFERSL